MQLADLSRPLQSFRETALGSGWLSVAVGTPEALWQLGCVFYMSLVAGLAALKINNLSNKNHKNDWMIFFRKPQIVTVSYFCALLMRMSWAPMEGMSERSFHLYSVGATLLTVLTTWVAAAQIHALLFSRMPKIAAFLENMAQEVTRIAQLHRSFLLFDWVMCLFSNVSIEGKVLRSCLLLVYWKTVTALEGTGQSVRQTSIK